MTLQVASRYYLGLSADNRCLLPPELTVQCYPDLSALPGSRSLRLDPLEVMTKLVRMGRCGFLTSISNSPSFFFFKRNKTKPLILKAVDIGHKQKSLGPRLGGPEFLRALKVTSCITMGKPLNFPGPQCCEKKSKELYHMY